ncbi:hypothetical protein [Burkholderia sp. BCC0419]|uniref:hypothetical protein n=1 Tax=Burkholderia sp. BCC0419 TaxID=486878 RepID=UPI00158E59F8|nr:hypothetical protein [Burkholderia sp. BCC0419]
MKVELLFPPILENSSVWIVRVGNVQLGINFGHRWCINTGGEGRLIQTPNDMMPMLPLLEIGRGDFYEHLLHIESSWGKLLELTESFPESLLLRFAFDSSFSDYWPIKALDWLDNESSIDSEVMESLRRISGQRWVSQNLRQRVKKKIGK